MDPAGRTAIIDAIHDAQGRIIPLPVPSLDLLLVGRAGDNYVLLLPAGEGLTTEERAWLHRWRGCAEVVRSGAEAMSACEAAYLERMREQGG